jgi:hypothetical protein
VGPGEADDNVSGRSHGHHRAILMSASGQFHGHLRAISRGRRQARDLRGRDGDGALGEDERAEPVGLWRENAELAMERGVLTRLVGERGRARDGRLVMS